MGFGRKTVAGVLVTMLALGSGLVTPALAATGMAARPAPPRAPLHAGASNTAGSVTDTTVFAGYEVTTGEASVVDRFVIPSISCPSDTTSGIGPGAYMVAGPSGEDFDGADVSMQCSDGSLLTGEYVVVDNTNTEYSDPVSPGDVIEASVSLTSTATTVTIKDLTKADRFSLVGTASGASGVSEFVGVDTLSNSSGVLPVPAFSSVKFSDSSLGGTPLGGTSPSALALTFGCAVTLLPTAVAKGTNFHVQPPTISIADLDPTSGPIGTPVTITGTGFTPTSRVRFNGVAAKTVTYSSSTELQATVPAKATSGPVSVDNTTAPRGTGTSVCDFTVGSST
jgi:IPT/TIG domain